MRGIPYHRTPLDVGQFRLFELEPSTQDAAVIVGKLCAVSTERCPKFRAVCHRPGQYHTLAAIDCDGEPIEVPTHFLEAVRAIRHRHNRLHIWSDFICVNYEDEKEKSAQHSMTPKIISLASELVLYISSESDDVKVALELVAQLTTAKHSFLPRTQPPPLPSSSKNSDIHRYRRALPSSRSSGWRAVNELLWAEMFENVWAICNLIYSQRATFQWGRSYKVDAQEFSSALETYELYSHPNLIRDTRARTLIDLERLRQRIRAGNTDNGLLFSVIKQAFPLSPNSGRDKIFAITQALASSPEHPQGLAMEQVDISRPDNEVYLQIAHVLNLIDPATPFISLSFAGNTARPGVQRGNGERVPFWVPDWANPQEPIYQLNEATNTFHASSGYPALSPGPERYYKPNMEFYTLDFPALIIDVLDQISTFNPPRRPADRLNVAAMNSVFFSEWWNWLQQKVPDKYKNSEERLLQDWVETIQATAPSEEVPVAKRAWRLLATAKSWWTLNKDSREAKEASRLLDTARSWLTLLVDENQEETEEILQFHAACLPSCGRRLGITKRGVLCLVPRNASPGDIICIPRGSKVPFVFHGTDIPTDRYENVGECYVHGAMSGEAVKWEGVREAQITLC